MSTQPLLQRTAAKRIALPVKVEPKVSFANERTFLSWLHFTVVLGGLAVGLLNFGDRVRSLLFCSFVVVSKSYRSERLVLLCSPLLVRYIARSYGANLIGSTPSGRGDGVCTLDISLEGKLDSQRWTRAIRRPDRASAYSPI